MLDIIGGSRLVTQANLGDKDDRVKIQLLFFQLCILKNVESIGLIGSRRDSTGIFRLFFSTALIMSTPPLRLVGFPGICNCNFLFFFTRRKTLLLPLITTDKDDDHCLVTTFRMTNQQTPQSCLWFYMKPLGFFILKVLWSLCTCTVCFMAGLVSSVVFVSNVDIAV